MHKTALLSRKELASCWSNHHTTTMLAIFLATTCFAVFGAGGLLGRRAVDIRPLLHWLAPALLFPAAALTMRQWSEERRLGTLELLLALPLALWPAALGKFLATMAVLSLALALTLPIPALLAALAPLDWGPVLGGYLACLLLAAVYTALGLWLSALTSDSLAAFLATLLAGGLLYLAGAPAVVSAAPAGCRDLLANMGAASRFARAARGLLDLRDLVYFGSLCAMFLLLSGHSVERRRWGDGQFATVQQRSTAVRLAFTAGGLLGLNLLLSPLRFLQWDLRGRDEAAQSLAALSELQEITWPWLTGALILLGLAGVSAAIRAWLRREKPLPLSERDAWLERGLIG